MGPDRGPNVRFPPPTLFVAGYLIGLWLEAAGPIRWMGGGAWSLDLQIAGLIVGVLGLALSAWGAVTFRRADTAVMPMRPATRLVTHGPYRFTRNPMYLGLTLGYVGLAFVMKVTWPLVLLPAVLGALHGLVIRKEERYLADAFGEQYLTYRARVRRWM